MALRFAVLAIVISIATSVVSAQPADKLVYATTQKVEFEVSADGLSSIRANARELAKGEWTAFNAENWFLKSPSPASFDKPTRKFERIAADHARVTHSNEQTTCIYDYTFAGEDCTISARVENRNPEAALQITGFSGLVFTFARQPDGYMCEQHISYFMHHGQVLMHPSIFAPVGGSYAQDGAVGVGVSPWRTGLTRTLILWDYTDWNVGKREKLPSRRLMYFVGSPVAARGANTFDLKIRVSPDTNWRHLLAPYREHFQATFGPVKYQADYRWIATDYLNHSVQKISPENPYGFHDGYKRIDTKKGADEFCQTLIPLIRDHKGQGLIVWGQGGEDPRGGMYRPDFDILPPAVEANFLTIAKRFNEAGLKLGVCTRPHHIAYRHDWKTDGIIDINPDDPWHREMLWRRFDTMIKRGCTMFYLDSFGDSFDDVKLMRYLREKLGPNIATFAEHQCDAIFPYSAGYSESTQHADVNPPYYRLWSDARLWEIYEWLTPGAQMTSRLYEFKGTPPKTMEGPDHWFNSHRITTLLPASDFGRIKDTARAQGKFLAGPNRWRE